MTVTELSLFGETTKPPYHVTPLADLPSANGLTAVSTFSGCGGSSLGLKMAGWTIPYAVEFIPMARDTYLANSTGTHVDDRDIREITGADILNHIGLDVGQLDLFEGSPPCSSFSMANTSKDARFGANKVKHYSDGVHQSTDDLFDEWLRLIDDLKPKAILAENVPGLAHSSEGRPYFQQILSRLSELGYWIDSNIYDSSVFGCATSRRRLIITGLRKDVSNRPPSRPLPSEHRYTLGEAMATCPPSPQDEIDNAQMDRFAIGGEWHRIKQGENSEKYFQLYRCRWDEPVPTIVASGKHPGSSSVAHPDECRKFTATEVKWISGFPDDFTLLGDPKQRYERVGRAVTPPLYEAVGKQIAKELAP